MTIPHGICLDLETTITSKIPDHIRPSGQKRFETRILEIGAVLWHNPCLTYRAIVNPIGKDIKIQNPKHLFQHLTRIYQHPTRTLNFWSRVLVKGKVLTRDMFQKPEDPEVWLVRQIDSRAKDFVRWHNDPSTGPAFVSEKDALHGLLSFSEKHRSTAWLAHNGHSFDYKVLHGCALRCQLDIPSNIEQFDTLKIFRKLMPGLKSYSQPIFFKQVLGRQYNAHIAIDDAKALSELCRHLATASPQTVTKPPKTNGRTRPGVSKITRKPMNLTFCHKTDVKPHLKKQISSKVISLRGIGPKTAAALAVMNIHHVGQLRAAYNKQGKEWLKNILPYGAKLKVIAKSIERL
tara:strand:- start:6449 stop:7492 length:1044 start_codon:yes stop_codon:yes gene_type:complete